jgi:hypothetical protein
MRSLRPIAILIALTALGQAQQPERRSGKAASARERKLTRAITRFGAERTEFHPSPYHLITGAYSDRHAEIWRIRTTKTGERFRIYRVGQQGLREVAQLFERRNGTVMVRPNAVQNTIGETVKTTMKGGLMILNVRDANGRAFSYEYDPESGIVTDRGTYFYRFGKGLSPARVHQAYRTYVDLRDDY